MSVITYDNASPAAGDELNADEQDSLRVGEELAGQQEELLAGKFKSAEDPVVKPERSREMVQAIKELGGKPRYTEYPGVGHNSWSRSYGDPELYKWMFSQQRK